MKRPTVSPAAALAPSDPFWEVKRRVIAATGHFYYADKDDSLLERLRRRLAAVGDRDFAAYLARLEEPVAGPAEWRALEAEISIGETFFFRYADQFEALRRVILPDLLERNAASRELRILSAGCSTGAEAYSIAILLDEMLGGERAAWRISILGVDLNNDVLAAAREAVFSRWALRSLTPEQRDAWFTPLDSRWALRPRYREGVRFARLNLLDLLGAAPPLEITDFDLILCRNVLIYFHPDQVLAVSSALVDRLKPEGWLLVGHAEANLGFGTFSKAVLAQDIVAYRPLSAVDRVAPQPVQTARPPSPWSPAVVEPPPPPRRPARPAPSAPRPAPRPPAQEPNLDTALERIRALADTGDLAGAATICDRALAQTPDHAPLQFYCGVVAQAAGRLAEAEAALRRAVYLDPGFVMAHYHLGLVRLEMGSPTARRAIKAAATLAGTFSRLERLPHGGGLTAGDLIDFARLQLVARGAGG